MLDYNLHEQPQDLGINVSATGDNTIVTSITNGEQFIHKIVVSADAATTLTFKCGSRVVGYAKLAANGSYNDSDLNGMAGEPTFKLYQGEAFIINQSGTAVLTGTIKYSKKTI